MTVLGFHASHEQIDPRTLLADLRRAEEAGFDAGMCSDHFAPWSQRQGESGFAWSWLGAALEATRLPMGLVNAPGQRYHPAIVAQAAATLTQMYPGRLWVALGSGQALNEHITGDPWPTKPERNERLRQSAETIRALLAGEEVTVDETIRVDRARLWSLPDVPPQLLAAAVSPATAGWAAEWADGLATINQEPDAVREVLDAYRHAGGRGPAVLQVHLSLAPTHEEALVIAHDQWRTNVFEPDLMWELESPQRFDAIGEHVSPETVAESVLVDDDPERLADRIAELARLGFDQVMLHHVGQDQSYFLTTAGEVLLPRLREVLA